MPEPFPEGPESSELAEVYAHLRRVARAYLSPAAQTLQPTALVHEAYIRLADQERAPFNDETHFVCTAAKVMRHVLVDYARSRRAEKRGGNWDRVTLDGLSESDEAGFDAMDVSDALELLETLSPRQARIVELRFFAGLKTDQIAEVIGVSERTVRDDWRFAKAWLRAQLMEGGANLGNRSAHEP
ncbi:MAG: ECF-type sigma factor [Phycisphaerales bacterium]